MTKLSDIKKYAADVANKFHPKKIILFGSYAYGKPTKDSDVDLMVVMPFKGRAVDQMVKIRQEVRAPFAMDLLACTPADLRERVRTHDWFMMDVVEKGKVLYEKTNG
jgi:predicted nucleotidyltransferase